MDKVCFSILGNLVFFRFRAHHFGLSSDEAKPEQPDTQNYRDEKQREHEAVVADGGGPLTIEGTDETQFSGFVAFQFCPRGTGE